MRSIITTLFLLKIKEAAEILIVTKCCFCLPLRKGLIVFAYIMLAISSVLLGMTVLMLPMTLMLLAMAHMVFLMGEMVIILINIVALVVFIIALHGKNVILLRGYLHFGIAFTIFCFIYSLAAFVVVETGVEAFVIFLHLLLNVYLMIMVWSYLVKMEKDRPVKSVSNLAQP